MDLVGVFGKKPNNNLHADCHKWHVFCERAAKAPPLMAAGEVGVSTTFHRVFCHKNSV